MITNHSTQFFEDQFRRQVVAGEHDLNSFEAAALPHIRGDVLDYGCGLGNLAVLAAQRGCTVVALDASHVAVDHLRKLAKSSALSLRAHEADLRTYEITDDFDTVVCIGLLMFFDCTTALAQLKQLQSHVRPGGIAVVNVLTEGTTFLDMFSPEGHCLFKPEQLRGEFEGWNLIDFQSQAFPAPRDTRKVFSTLIARRPEHTQADA